MVSMIFWSFRENNAHEFRGALRGVKNQVLFAKIV